MKNQEIDDSTKKAWERNWDTIAISEIMEIFDYERVKEQMALFTRVLPKHGKILEGGCGLAPYLIKLRQMGYDIEGIDYNQGPIDKILAYDETLPVKVGDVTQIPYQDNSLEGYISLGVIEHFTEGPEKAIKEANRVLKRGGVFYVSVPRNNIFMRLVAPIRWFKRNSTIRKWFGKPQDVHYWEQYFKRDVLKKILEEKGFEVREIHALDHSHALASIFSCFRDKDTYDEVSPLGQKIGRVLKKFLPWSSAAQMAYVCYKK